MVPVMRPIRFHRRPMILARLVCLALMMALLASPVLAVVSISMECGGPCCCADTGPAPTATIRVNADLNSACCGPTQSTPCGMTAGSLPNVPLALIRATQRDNADAIHLLPGGFNAAVNPRSNHLAMPRIDTGENLATSRLYLQSCRFIC